MWVLVPKPPPMVGWITRTCGSGTPSIRAMVVRTMWGLCVDDQTVSWPSAESATTPLVSMGSPVWRWMT